MNLCYCSKMNLNIFPENNAFKFSSCLDSDKLIFDESQHIVCVKQIFMDGSVSEECDEGEVLAIKSNISMNGIISSSENSIFSIFTLKKHNNHSKETIALSFQNPIYFSTLKASLLNAHFEIWNLDKNKPINIDVSFPTFIIVQIQSKLTIEMGMNKKILYINSKDYVSQQCFPNNINSNFTIQLPHNFALKTNATACLKSIFIPNEIKNIHDYNILIYFQNDDKKILKMNKDLEYDSALNFISNLNTIFVKEGIFFQLKEGKVLILKSIKSKVEKIKFCSKLASILGHSETIAFKNENFKKIGKEKLNLDFQHISFLIVDINIIEKTIFGENEVGMLKILPLKVDDSKISSYSFSENEKKKLTVRNFSQITIKILTDDLQIVNFSSKEIATKLMLEVEE